MSRKVKEIIRAAGLRDELTFTSVPARRLHRGGRRRSDRRRDAGAGPAQVGQGAADLRQAHHEAGRRRGEEAAGATGDTVNMSNTRAKNWVAIAKRTAAILNAKGFTIGNDGEIAHLDPELVSDVSIMQLKDGTLRLGIDTPGGRIRANVVDLHEEQLGDDPTIPPLPRAICIERGTEGGQFVRIAAARLSE